MGLFTKKAKVEGQPVHLMISNIKEIKLTLKRTESRLIRLNAMKDKVDAGTRKADKKAIMELQSSIARYTAQKIMLETVLNVGGHS